MDNRQYGRSQDPRQQSGPPPTWSTAGVPPWSTSIRPLSDIREITEPSLIDASAKRPSQSSAHSRKASIARQSSLKRAGSVRRANSSRSPVKQTSLRLDPVSSDASRRLPSRTFVRSPLPADILEFPTHRHPRVSIDLQIAAPLHVGGGSIEGYVRITVDDADRMRPRKSLAVSRLSVDLLGAEEIHGYRRAIFLSLGTEVLDKEHPPPRSMVVSSNPYSADDPFWTLTPCHSTLPFLVSLPLDTGPPPFHSKNARIRYVLCATLVIRDAGRQYIVRCSQDVYVLSTYDRKAFIDRSGRKAVKKLDLSLERDILYYRHAAAATRERSASQARIFESNERTILSRARLKHGHDGWQGVEPHTADTRTCGLELPRGHATVKCGKYFEVRYFLNVAVIISHTKTVSVQIPLILIHMNSLDVVPNCVAQVAAAIEEKRHNSSHSRTHSRNPSHKSRIHSRGPSTSSPTKSTQADIQRQPSRLQGRAFAAPRQQSLDRMRAEQADLDHLGQLLDSSPRKYAPRAHELGPSSLGAFSLGPTELGLRSHVYGHRASPAKPPPVAEFPRAEPGYGTQHDEDEDESGMGKRKGKDAPEEAEEWA
ncbi:hypothetical protein M8818_003237 [Zalaria obscura]|uniref:Uncharacterized protein n=1 Tax=Zalaria obscura TaxID=2024903 RepID=A0ACC3SG08_9PEZI